MGFQGIGKSTAMGRGAEWVTERPACSRTPVHIHRSEFHQLFLGGLLPSRVRFSASPSDCFDLGFQLTVYIHSLLVHH
jgi:hypothetical protein